MDFDGTKDDPIIQGILEKIRQRTVFMKVLGSYKKAKMV
jgi:prephenate dehydratase